MALKMSLLGVLVYAAMAAWLAALCAYGIKRRKAGNALFATGFALCLGALGEQWAAAGHVPLQSLFEVFLCLATFVYPLSLFWRRAIGVGGRATDVALALLAMFPAGFVFSAEPHALPPALQSPLFIPHVGAYLVAYVVMLKAGTLALRAIVRGRRPPEGQAADQRAMRGLVRLGFPLMTLGLVLGAVWGKRAWGDYWNWDPKELCSLATWCIFAGYFHACNVWGMRRPRLLASILALGVVWIILTLLWLNLAQGMFSGLHMYAMSGGGPWFG
jgi:ABC-type transport system involved in cytochrome c biogenesis permease subunit